MRNIFLYCIPISIFLSGCATLTPVSSPLPTINPSLTPFLDLTATSSVPTRSPTPLPSHALASKPESPETKPLQLIAAMVSPNTAWSAAVLVVDGSYLLQVASSDVPVVIWTIAEQEKGGNIYYPLILGWSEDGMQLYYTYQSTSWDGCFGSWAARGSDVWRLDLTSGATAQVANHLGHWMVLSPDGRQIAFLGTSAHDATTIANIVGVFDLATGIVTSAEIDFLAGKKNPSSSLDLLWSPDGKTLVFGALTNTCGLEDEDRYTIIHADAATLRQEILVKESEEWLQPVKWPEPNRVLLRGQNGHFTWLNLSSRALENWP